MTGHSIKELPFGSNSNPFFNAAQKNFSNRSFKGNAGLTGVDPWGELSQHNAHRNKKPFLKEG